MAHTTFCIDRDMAHTAFERYIEPYSINDPKIALEVTHTYHVADISEHIARALDFTSAGVDLAWLCGLLHDIGRFEQVRRSGTLNDTASAMHAAIGADILFNNAEHLADGTFTIPSTTNQNFSIVDETFFEHVRATGSIHAFLSNKNPEAEAVLSAAVMHHSDYRLPNNLDVRKRAFCDLTRDADKIDILRTYTTNTIDIIIGCTEDELLQSVISSTIEDAFFEHHTVPWTECLTPVDYLINVACFAFELTYPVSLGIMIDQGYVFNLFSHPFGITHSFKDKATARLLAQMDGHLRSWIDEQTEN